jgi:hypothetical protein
MVSERKKPGDRRRRLKLSLEFPGIDLLGVSLAEVIRHYDLSASATIYISRQILLSLITKSGFIPAEQLSRIVPG